MEVEVKKLLPKSTSVKVFIHNSDLLIIIVFHLALFKSSTRIDNVKNYEFYYIKYEKRLNTI